MPERKIIIAGSIIMVLGIARSFQKQQPLDAPIVGGLTLMLLLAGLAAFGPAPAALAGDFAILALLSVTLSEAVPLLQKASKL